MRSRFALSIGILIAGFGAGHSPAEAATVPALPAPALDPAASLAPATVLAAATELAPRLPSRPSPAELAAGAQVTGFANFDGGLAPCDFEEVNAFIGTLENLQVFGSFGNGGAILDDCAGLGIDALSGDNVLAFDFTRTLLNGARPVLPQLFTGPASTIMGFSVASATPQTLTILGLNESGVTDVRTFTTTPGAWETHFAFTGGGIFFSAIVVLGAMPQLVVDDAFAVRF